MSGSKTGYAPGLESLSQFLPQVRHALSIKAAHRLSYWDSAIIAAAVALGCEVLYSQDLAHGRQVEGVLIQDPFR